MKYTRREYHARNLTHSDQLLTKPSGNTFLNASGEVDASPIHNYSSINHFLDTKEEFELTKSSLLKQMQATTGPFQCFEGMPQHVNKHNFPAKCNSQAPFAHLIPHIPLTDLRLAVLLFPCVVILELKSHSNPNEIYQGATTSQLQNKNKTHLYLKTWGAGKILASTAASRSLIFIPNSLA